MRGTEFERLFILELRDLYSAESQLFEALPWIIECATTTDLKEALRSHLTETETQIERLKRVFEFLKESPIGETSEALKGLLDETREIQKNQFVPIVKDAALIASMQRIDHYAIAGYGVARTFAKHLNYDDAVDLLKESLLEEGNANENLTAIAEGGFFTRGINTLAAGR